MKHIVKQPEPLALRDWKSKASADWKPSYDDLLGAEKHAVKQSLMEEQGFICCYCERRLWDDESHIEHFLPQHDPQCDPLDYGNFLCSCQNRIEKGEPRHCGNLKGDWFDSVLMVSPLNADCENRFAFAADGSIRASDPTDRGAAMTIEKLGLDIRKLQNLRRNAIDPFLAPDLSDHEVRQFVDVYLRIDHQGKFGEFWTTVHYLFGQ